MARIFIARLVRYGNRRSRAMSGLRVALPNWMHGTKTIHAAYKDLRRRDRFSADFRPTPYDVWSFRHDRAFGIPHPGLDSRGDHCPCALLLHPPDALVVDPLAGGGTTLDVCQSMGRRCLAYDIEPVRPEIKAHDIRHGFPAEAIGATSSSAILLTTPCWPANTRPMELRQPRSRSGCNFSATLPAMPSPRSRRRVLCLAARRQTEKDLPAGFGYLDHAFLGYSAALHAGFQPERRISCPMEGAIHLSRCVKLVKTDACLGRSAISYRRAKANPDPGDRPLPYSLSCKG